MSCNTDMVFSPYLFTLIHPIFQRAHTPPHAHTLIYPHNHLPTHTHTHPHTPIHTESEEFEVYSMYTENYLDAITTLEEMLSDAEVVQYFKVSQNSFTVVEEDM